MGVLVIAGHVAGHRGRAGGRATDNLRERLVGLGHDQLGLEGRSASGESVLRDRMAAKRKRQTFCFIRKERTKSALNEILFKPFAF